MKSIFIANLSTPQKRGISPKGESRRQHMDETYKPSHPLHQSNLNLKITHTETPIGDFRFVSNIGIMIHFYGGRSAERKMNKFYCRSSGPRGGERGAEKSVQEKKSEKIYERLFSRRIRRRTLLCMRCSLRRREV